MLSWANRFNICCFLDDHNYALPGNHFSCLLAVGALHTFKPGPGKAFEELHNFQQTHNEWLIGHLSYDLKSEIEDLKSSNPDHVLFPLMHFFVPETLILIRDETIVIGVHNERHEEIYQQVLHAPSISEQAYTSEHLQIFSRFSRDEYIATVEKIREHILRGDCYELNFCQEFYAENVALHPLQTFLSLINVSPNPFSAYYKVDDKYCLCASPERFLARRGNNLFSQPIKGTSARDLNDEHNDRLIRDALYHNLKDRSENVMTVDLVRNDMSRICINGSVKVSELYGVYTFPQVHQMISTIEGELSVEASSVEAIKACFPMGSMTGAPKKRVMELIEEYERTRRGLFSGAIGYFEPNGDFDFNVVIRSILYNSDSGYLSFQVGSAITYASDVVAEYDECLLKGQAIKKVLTSKT